MRGTYNTETKTLKIYQRNHLLGSFYIPVITTNEIPLNPYESVELNLDDEELLVWDRVERTSENIELTFV